MQHYYAKLQLFLWHEAGAATVPRPMGGSHPLKHMQSAKRAPHIFVSFLVEFQAKPGEGYVSEQMHRGTEERTFFQGCFFLGFVIFLGLNLGFAAAGVGVRWGFWALGWK